MNDYDREGSLPLRTLSTNSLGFVKRVSFFFFEKLEEKVSRYYVDI